MNFLSHYIVLPEHDNSYLTLGCIFPDLLRETKPQFDTLYEKTRHSKEYSTISLVEGIKNHVDTDAYFHNSDFFSKWTKHLASAIRKDERIKMNRYTYFLAHILLEMYIDKYYIMKDFVQVERFYDLIRQTSEDTLRVFFYEYVVQFDFDLFKEKKEVFLKRAFLKDYVQDDFILTAADKILQKVGIQNINQSDKKLILQIIDTEFFPKMTEELPKFMETLKKTI